MYAEHLTERLLLRIFKAAGRETQLLIFRPSCIGPAEQEPFPGFEVAGSVPLTTATCAVIMTPPGRDRCSSNLADPAQATSDEVPVDIVVNRLVVHLAIGTYGCVHAVSGASHHRSTIACFEAMARNRSGWLARPTVKWYDESTPENKLWPASKLFKTWGCSYLFHEEKTKTAWQLTDSPMQRRWPLFTKRNPSDTSDFVTRGQNARKMLLAWLGKKYGRLGRWGVVVVCLGPQSTTLSVLEPATLAPVSSARVSLTSIKSRWSA